VHRLRSKVQLVMQDGRGSLHPYFSIRKLLEQVVDVRKKTEPNYSIDLARHLQTVGLPENILPRKAASLSGGECLRVSIARALVMQPEILICDESTSALDGPTRDGIIDLLIYLMKEYGLAVIFISHDERIIRGISNDVLVLSEGKVVEQGLASEVIGRPTHPVTKKIFGSYATLKDKRRL
jgi:ABC-type dipeptide/oligopeptide/nickel transport system ATPase subunit